MAIYMYRVRGIGNSLPWYKHLISNSLRTLLSPVRNRKNNVDGVLALCIIPFFWFLFYFFFFSFSSLMNSKMKILSKEINKFQNPYFESSPSKLNQIASMCNNWWENMIWNTHTRMKTWNKRNSGREWHWSIKSVVLFYENFLWQCYQLGLFVRNYKHMFFTYIFRFGNNRILSTCL